MTAYLVRIKSIKEFKIRCGKYKARNIDLVDFIQFGFDKSKTEAKRLVKKGAIDFDLIYEKNEK